MLVPAVSERKTDSIRGGVHDSVVSGKGRRTGAGGLKKPARKMR
jgi:hypothetical protein